MAQPDGAPLDLRASGERFGKAFAQAAIGVWLADTEGRFLQVNEAFCNILGFTREELAPDRFLLNHPSRRPRGSCRVHQIDAGRRDQRLRYRKALSEERVRKSVSLGPPHWTDEFNNLAHTAATDQQCSIPANDPNSVYWCLACPGMRYVCGTP
jgi:PAS domain-containing protein